MAKAKACPRCSAIFPDDAVFCPFDGAALVRSVDKLIGKTIASRYRLTKRLGSGGMSVVYLARHELISRLNAIKILRPELSRVAEHRERFLREARAVNRINHENIVEITDVGESDGVAYLVMEYIEGESLLAHVQRGPLRWDRAVKIAIQVASALARTHQANVIHRDLKPENILLIPRKDADERVKLTDFGIAKLLGEPTLTLSDQLFGTPGYIAPEYVAGESIDGRADLYSLAVVLYEMLTARLPFEGAGQSDLLLKPLTSAPIPPSQRVGGLPPDLESLLLRCLARDPRVRPHDAFAFHDALADILRRLGADAVLSTGGSVPPAPRDPLETVVDRISATELAAASAVPEGGEPITGEIGTGWNASLAELEASIARARRAGGESAARAGRAAELAMVASEMLPRVERGRKQVADLQARVDRLEAAGREFRANLGHAIDVLVHDRSRERAHLDALRARREALQRALEVGSSVEMPMPMSDARPWEVEALADEETRVEGVVSDLAFQVDELQTQLDHRNEEHERDLVKATGSLEGSLSGLRRLGNEIARTIEDGIALLQRAG